MKEEKVLLPIKTKIAAWWMIVLLPISSVIISFVFFMKFIGSFFPIGGISGPYFMAFYTIIGGVIFGSVFFFGNLITGVFLLKRKRKAWKFSVGLIFICIIVLGLSGLLELKEELEVWKVAREFTSEPILDTGDILFFFSILSLFLIPLILLFLDRKNFWKIAS